METYPDFAAYLEAANSQNKQQRDQSSTNLSQCKQADSTKFICSLIKELCSEENSQGARHMASLIFKNTLINATQEEGQSNLWYHITEEVRGFIKEALLGMLASTDRATLKNASIDLAIIAAIEVPDGHWDHFLQSMADNSTNENIQFRLASIQTLGYLCEFLDQYIDKQLSQQQIGLILHSMICNIADQQTQQQATPEQLELTTIAIKALARTIPQTQDNFQNKEQRDFIMNGIFNAMASTDEDVQLEALQALIEVINVGYESISEYIQKIGEATIGYLQARKSAQTKSILSFWTHICQAEIEFGKRNESANIIGLFKESLMQIIFEALNITEFDNDDDKVEDSPDDINWTISRAAGSLFVEVTTIIGDGIVNETLVFAHGKLQGLSWQEHYVGLIALGSICEGPSSETIAREFDLALPTIMTMLSTSHSSRVRNAAIWLISQLTKCAPQLFTVNEQNLRQLIDTGLQHLEKDHMQIKQFIAVAFHQLYEATGTQGQSSARQVLTTHFSQIMSALLSCFFSEESLVSGSILSLSNSVNTILEQCDHANLKAELMQVCEFIFNKVSGLVQSAPEGLNLEQREHLLNNWCSSLQPCLVRVGKDSISDEMLGLFVDLAIKIFQQHGKVMNGSLFILHGLICTVEERITPYIPKFIDFIVCSLQMENCDQMGTRVSCGLISDLANSVPVVEYLPKIMPVMLRILNDNAFESEVKLIAITAFGDIVLSSGTSLYLQYLDETKKAFSAASELSLSLGTNSEEVDLFQRLRIALLDAYVSIIHGFAPEEQPLAPDADSAVESFASTMFEYLVNLVAHKELAFPPELLKPMYELYLDLAVIYADVRRMEDMQRQQRNFLGPVIVHSGLINDLRQGLGAISPEDQREIEPRFIDTENSVARLRSQVASPAPQPPITNNSTWVQGH